MQGQLWGEMLTSGEALEYIACPKIFGLSEAAWTCPALDAASAGVATDVPVETATSSGAVITGAEITGAVITGAVPPAAPLEGATGCQGRLEASWANFANALGQQHLATIAGGTSDSNFAFRVPSPQLQMVGAVLENGSVVLRFHASCEFPGLDIRYTISIASMAGGESLEIHEPDSGSLLCDVTGGVTEARCTLPPATGATGGQARVQVRACTFDQGGRGGRKSASATAVCCWDASMQMQSVDFL
jgi:hypothetical protein